MFLDHLSLTNFRNFRSLDLALAKGPTILIGDNAQGKSNLLEAVYLLSTSRSPNATRDNEMVSWHALEDDLPLARVRGKVKRNDRDIALEVLISGPSNKTPGHRKDEGAITNIPVRKQLRVNGVPRRASEFIGQAAAVIFGPQETDMISDTPSMRRRFIDVALSQVEPKYTRALQKYNKVLVQRNHLLRRIYEGLSSPDELDFWDNNLVISGSEVLTHRLDAMERISIISAEAHDGLAGGKERMEAYYQSNIIGDAALVDSSPSADEINAAFLRELAVARGRDIRQGQTTVGPHRDDIKVAIDGRPADLYGSRGQQRTAALALKLAEAKFMEERLGEQPVLLLDDVFSELDSSRRGYLMDVARGHQQVLITTTDLDRLGESPLYLETKLAVMDGTVRPL